MQHIVNLASINNKTITYDNNDYKMHYEYKWTMVIKIKTLPESEST